MTTTSFSTSFFSLSITLMLLRPFTFSTMVSKPTYEKVMLPVEGTSIEYLPSISVMVPDAPAFTLTPTSGSPPGSVTVPVTFTCWAEAVSVANSNMTQSTNLNLEFFMFFDSILEVLLSYYILINCLFT